MGQAFYLGILESEVPGYCEQGSKDSEKPLIRAPFCPRSPQKVGLSLIANLNSEIRLRSQAVEPGRGAGS